MKKRSEQAKLPKEALRERVTFKEKEGDLSGNHWFHTNSIRRAQVTAFIIIAIVLVFAVIAIFLAKPDIINIKSLTISSEMRPVHSFIQSCVEQTTENAIQHIGDNGGYYIPPNKSLFNGIPIYFDKGETKTLTNQEIELELSKYVNEMLFFCTKNFADFSDLKVEQEEIKTTTQIQKGKVVFNINYPLSISKAEKTYTFNKFDTETKVRLFTINQVANKIIEDQKEFPEDLCITCIQDVAMKNEVVVDMRDFQDSIIFSIIDIKNLVNGNDFTFYFANEY